MPHPHRHLSAFDEALLISREEIAFSFRGLQAIEQANFILNPRRLRGSDFLMRWSQGVWSEERVVQAINKTADYYAIPYGPSGVAPSDDVRAFEEYFERLEAAGLGKIKRPDLLLFPHNRRDDVDRIVEGLGGLSELPFTAETNMQELLAQAIVAIECENSLWRATQMPDYNTPMRPQKRLGGKPGLKKGAVVPTVILKEEDRTPLIDWQQSSNIPIHIWHVFFDMAFGIALDEIVRLVDSGYIEPTRQTFQAPGGATSTKIIYKTYYHYAYKLGHATEEPALAAKSISDKNGHILPYVTFEGGALTLDKDVFEVLDKLSSR